MLGRIGEIGEKMGGKVGRKMRGTMGEKMGRTMGEKMGEMGEERCEDRRETDNYRMRSPRQNA